jgi:hypothetical protein
MARIRTEVLSVGRKAIFVDDVLNRTATYCIAMGQGMERGEASSLQLTMRAE